MNKIVIDGKSFIVNTKVEGCTPYGTGKNVGNFAGKETIEWFNFNGITYSRTVKHSHYSFDTKQFFYAKNSEGNDFDIVCECGCTTFKLRYDSYAIDAVCSNCGNQETVYDG